MREESTERYMIFRVYKEDDEITHERRYRFWGWTRSKSALKVFKKQRDMDKYKIIKMDDDEIAREFSENETADDTMLEYVNLGDVKSGEMIPFFTTKVELQEAEIKIQRMVINGCSLDGVEDVVACVNIILNLNQYYSEVLEFIGYQPKEIGMLFETADSTDDSSSIDGIEQLIFNAYDGSCDSPQETYT